MALETPGAERIVSFAGFSVVSSSNASHSGTIFVGLKPFEERGSELSAEAVAAELGRRFAEIQEGSIFVVSPPPVRGIGSGGDFKLMVQDRSGQGLETLERVTWELAGAAMESGNVSQAFTTFSTSSPQYYLDIDRTRAEMMNVPVGNVFDTLQIFLGSSYVNDFTLFGRNYRVTAQADAPFRTTPEDIARLRTRNASGDMVPLGSIVAVRPTSGPDRIVRHNLYPSTELQVGTPAGASSGDTLTTVEKLAADVLPPGIGYEWSELAFQQRETSSGLLIFR